MKKSIVIMATATLALMATGCTKEGQFNPKEKISKVYEMDEYTNAELDVTTGEWVEGGRESTPKHLIESWNWDGKKLMSIDYYDMEEQKSGTAKMEYDGKQITKMTDEDEYYTFEYDGKMMDKIKCYSDGALQQEMTLIRDGKKINSIKITSYNDDDEDEEEYEEEEYSKKNSINILENTLWKIILPTEGQQMVKDCKKKLGKNNESYVVNLTWDGNNITKMSMAASFYNVSVTMTYDDKKNPYLGFYGYFSEDPIRVLSENNMVSQTYQGEEGENNTETFSYKYDGKWPVERTQVYSYESEEHDYRSKSTTVLYYEYKD